jgi:hypothetical protein
LGQGQISLILKDVAVNKSGMEMTDMVDDGCDCFVMMDGGYEIMDSESKQSDNISMSAIVVMMNDRNEVRKKGVDI